jgi:hypothetical protein
MDELHTEARTRLVADLVQLRQEAGEPSLGQLVKASNGNLSRSTLDDHLSGRRERLPSWRLVSAYVDACHSFARSTGLDTARLGTMEEWRVRFAAALKGVTAASPIRDPTIASTYALEPGELQHLQQLNLLRAKASPAPSHRTPDGPTVQVQVRDETGDITGIMLRLEEDLSRLGDSLPVSVGLLVILSGPIIGTRFAVESDVVTIGRSRKNDVRLYDMTVSSSHAEIHRIGHQFAIADMGSTNGTFLNEKRISAEESLDSYNELQIGAFRLLFVRGGSYSGRSR